VINLQTKFELSVFTRYEDMKCNAKCRIWSGLGLGVTQGHRQCHQLIEFICFRVIASYLSTVANFNLPTCIWRLH